MSEPAEIVRIEKVEKRYGRHNVLEIDQLVFRDGDRVILNGRNGSGKTTLLKLLARVVPPDRGRVWWAPETKEQGLGYVPQAGGLYDELTVLENLHLRRFLHGMRRADRTVVHQARALGLLPMLDKRVGELSGGYQRLTAIAAALQVDPRWLLLDEPFYGIDPDHLGGLLAELAEIQRRLRLLMIAESGESVYGGATRVVTLNKGRVSCVEP